MKKIIQQGQEDVKNPFNFNGIYVDLFIAHVHIRTSKHEFRNVLSNSINTLIIIKYL